MHFGSLTERLFDPRQLPKERFFVPPERKIEGLATDELTLELKERDEDLFFSNPIDMDPASGRYFAMLHGDHIIGNSGLESGRGLIACQYLNHWFGRAQAFLSDEERDELTAVTEGLDQVVSDTEAVKGCVGYAKVHKVFELLHRQGSARLSLRFGKHVYLIEAKVATDGSYSLSIYNGGLGVSAHPAFFARYKVKIDPRMQYRGFSDSKLSSVFSLLFSIHDDKGNTKYKKEQVYNVLKALLNEHYVIDEQKRFKQPHRSGVCAMAAFKHWAAYHLRPELFKKLMTLTKWLTVDRICQALGDDLQCARYHRANPAVIYFLQRAIENTARRFEKSSYGTFGPDVEEMQKRLEGYMVKLLHPVPSDFPTLESRADPAVFNTELKISDKAYPKRQFFNWKADYIPLFESEGSEMIPASELMDEAKRLLENLEGGKRWYDNAEFSAREIARFTRRLDLDEDALAKVLDKDGYCILIYLSGIYYYHSKLFRNKYSVVSAEDINASAALYAAILGLCRIYESRMNPEESLEVARHLLPSQEDLFRKEIVPLNLEDLKEFDRAQEAIKRGQVDGAIYADLEKEELIVSEKTFTDLPPLLKSVSKLFRKECEKEASDHLEEFSQFYHKLMRAVMCSEFEEPESPFTEKSEKYAYLVPLLMSVHSYQHTTTSMYSTFRNEWHEGNHPKSEKISPLDMDKDSYGDRHEMFWNFALAHRCRESGDPTVLTTLNKIEALSRRETLYDREAERGYLKDLEEVDERIKEVAILMLNQKEAPHHLVSYLIDHLSLLSDPKYVALFTNQLCKSVVSDKGETRFLIEGAVDAKLTALLSQFLERLLELYPLRPGQPKQLVSELCGGVRLVSFALHLIKQVAPLHNCETLEERLKSLPFEEWLATAENVEAKSLLRMHRLYIQLTFGGDDQMMLSDHLFCTRNPLTKEKAIPLLEMEIVSQFNKIKEGKRALAFTKESLHAALVGAGYIEISVGIEHFSHINTTTVQCTLTNGDRLEVNSETAIVSKYNDELHEYRMIASARDFKRDGPYLKFDHLFDHPERIKLHRSEGGFTFTYGGKSFFQAQDRDPSGMDPQRLNILYEGRYYCYNPEAQIFDDQKINGLNFLRSPDLLCFERRELDESGGRDLLFLDAKTFDVRYTIPDGERILDASGKEIKLMEIPSVSGIDLSRFQPPGYITEKEGRIEIQDSNMKLEDGRLTHHPNYHLSQLDLTDHFCGFKDYLAFQNIHERDKYLIAVPMQSLKSDGEASLKDFSPRSYEWERKSISSFVYLTYDATAGKIHATGGAERLTLAYLFAIMRQGALAMEQLRHITPDQAASNVEILHRIRGITIRDPEVTPAILYAMLLELRNGQKTKHLVKQVEDFYCHSYLPLLNNFSFDATLERVEELELLSYLGDDERLQVRRDQLRNFGDLDFHELPPKWTFQQEFKVDVPSYFEPYFLKEEDAEKFIQARDAALESDAFTYEEFFALVAKYPSKLDQEGLTLLLKLRLKSSEEMRDLAFRGILALEVEDSRWEFALWVLSEDCTDAIEAVVDLESYRAFLKSLRSEDSKEFIVTAPAQKVTEGPQNYLPYQRSVQKKLRRFTEPMVFADKMRSAEFKSFLEAFFAKRDDYSIPRPKVDLTEDSMLELIDEALRSIDSVVSDPRYCDVVKKDLEEFREAYIEGADYVESPYLYKLPEEKVTVESEWIEVQKKVIGQALQKVTGEVLEMIREGRVQKVILGLERPIELDDLINFAVSGEPQDILRYLPDVDHELLFERVMNMMLLTIATDHLEAYEEGLTNPSQFNRALAQLSEFSDSAIWDQRHLLAHMYRKRVRFFPDPSPQAAIIDKMSREKTLAEAVPCGGGKTTHILPALRDGEIAQRLLPLTIIPEDQYRSYMGIVTEKDPHIKHVTFDLDRDEMTYDELKKVERMLANAALGNDEYDTPHELILKRETIQTLALELTATAQKIASLKRVDETLTNKMELLKDILSTICNTNPVGDEGSILLDIFSRVNFPVGSAGFLDAPPAELMHRAVNFLLTDEKMAGIVGLQTNEQAHLSEGMYHAEIAPVVVRHLIESGALPNHDWISDYLLKKGNFDRELALVEPATRDLISFASHFIQELLYATLKQTHRISYGLKGPEIVPYLSANTPATTKFGYGFELYLYYLFSAAHEGISLDMGDILLSHLQEESQLACEHSGGVLDYNNTQAGAFFTQITGGMTLSACESGADRASAVEAINTNPSCRVTAASKFAMDQIRIYSHHMSASSIFLVELLGNSRILSGTLKAVFYSLHQSILTKGEPAQLNRDSGRIAYRYVHQGQVHVIDELKPGRVIANLLKERTPVEKERLRTLADPGGVFRICKDNLEVARELSEALIEENRPAVIFFYADNHQPALLFAPDADPVHIAAPTKEVYKRHGVEPEHVFNFIDAAHYYGTDCPIPQGSEMAMLLDRQLTAERIDQTTQRHRYFLENQTVTTLLPRKFAQTLGVEDDPLATHKTLLKARIYQAEQAADKAQEAAQEHIRGIVSAVFTRFQFEIGFEETEEMQKLLKDLKSYIYTENSTDHYALHGPSLIEKDNLTYLSELIRTKRDELTPLDLPEELIEPILESFAQLETNIAKLIEEGRLVKTAFVRPGAVGSAPVGHQLQIAEHVEMKLEVEQRLHVSKEVQDLFNVYKNDTKDSYAEPLLDVDRVIDALKTNKPPEGYIDLSTHLSDRAIYKAGDYGRFFNGVPIYMTYDYLDLDRAILSRRARAFENLLLVKGSAGYKLLCLSQFEMQYYKEAAKTQENVWVVSSAGNIIWGKSVIEKPKDVEMLIGTTNLLAGKIDLAIRKLPVLSDWLNQLIPQKDFDELMQLAALSTSQCQWMRYMKELRDSKKRHELTRLITPA
ncbi:MAG: hypothetical protein MRY21_06955 [Simkaniaceae bacterium]|nr:hypothetical protein [Simkaniaceae bacterium]